MMVKMADILLAGFLLAGILIQPSICQPETKCLMYLDEVREILATKVPPINVSRMTDNYYNISRAFFPSVDLPALYVRVTIQFLKDYQNGTKKIDDEKRSLKFTWSKACSYVSVQHLSLYAMSVFSLFTIYPQRRESELVMTVPPFCSSSPYAPKDDPEGSNTWRYVVSTLEDIVVNPKISDPRINSACCVIKGHEGDIDEYLNFAGYFCWFILVSSLLASISLWVILLDWIKDGVGDPEQGTQDRGVNNGAGEGGTESVRRIVTRAVLKMTIPLTFTIVVEVLLVPLLIGLKSKANSGMYLYYGIYIVFLLLCCLLVFVTYWKGEMRIEKGEEEDKKCSWLGSCLLPCLFQTVHHFLWVICGIISEPFWAIPIFLLECLLAISTLFAFFLHEKEFAADNESELSVKLELNKRWIKWHLWFCWGSFLLVLITVALIAVGNGNAVNSPTAGALEGAMVVIFIWFVKNSSLDFLPQARDN